MNTPWKGPTMVTLVDGSMVFSDAEAWRHESFARELIAGPPGRTASILAALVAEKPEVAERLRDTMAQIEAKAGA